MASLPTDVEPDGAAPAAFPDCMSSCNLLAETDHRTANHFALLASYARLRGAELEKADPITPDLVRLFTRGLDAHIAAIAQLHRILAIQARVEPLQLSDILQEVCGSFANGFADRVLLVQDLAADCLAQPDQILPVSQIVVEAMTNALKYACADNRATLVVRSRTANGEAAVEIVDHGPGPPQSFDPQTSGGLGFRLMRAHAKTLGGAISFDRTAEGFRVRLVLPAPLAQA